MLKTRIAWLRKKHNLSQEEVASLLKVKRNTYSNYEQGNRDMDYQSIVFLADYYKVTLDYIFGRSDDPIKLDSYDKDEVEFIESTLATYRKLKKTYFKS